MSKTITPWKNYWAKSNSPKINLFDQIRTALNALKTAFWASRRIIDPTYHQSTRLKLLFTAVYSVILPSFNHGEKATIVSGFIRKNRKQRFPQTGDAQNSLNEHKGTNVRIETHCAAHKSTPTPLLRNNIICRKSYIVRLYKSTITPAQKPHYPHRKRRVLHGNKPPVTPTLSSLQPHASILKTRPLIKSDILPYKYF